MARRLLPIAVVLAIVSAPGSADAVTGELTQLAGTQGCISDTGSGGECENGRELSDALSVTVSPDGRSVYTAALTTVAAFSRTLNGGALSQLTGTAGCTSNTGSGGECSVGRAIGGEGSTVVSPDGRHVYAAGQNADAVTAFSRNAATGAVTQLAGTAGCISETGNGGDCVEGDGLDGSRVLALSPDGLNVYVPSVFSDAIAVFRRNPVSGALTQLDGLDACVSDDGSGGDCRDVVSLDTPFTVTVSPDGRHVYAAADDDDAVVAFARNASTGALTQLGGTNACVSETGSGGDCDDGRGLDSSRGVAVSPSGRNVYVGSNQPGGVAILSRDAASGALGQTQDTTGCITENGSGGACTDGTALGGGHGVAVSPDDLNVYLAADDGNAVSTFARNASTGGLMQLAGTAGCTSSDGTSGDCVDGRGLTDAEFVTVSPDCRNVYTAAEADSAVAVFSREAPQACPAQATGGIAVRKTAAPTSVRRNGEVRYSVTVSATGSGGVDSVTVRDRLPADVAFRSATPSAGTCSQASGTVTCPLGALAAGAGARVEIVVSARECGRLVNTATVTATPSGASGGDNEATASVDVDENCPDEDPAEAAEDDVARAADTGDEGSGGELPFTGLPALLVLALGAVGFLGGLTLRLLLRG